MKEPGSIIRQFSNRLLTAQRGLRILDALRWGADVERQFLASRCRELPRVTRETYRQMAGAIDFTSRDAQLAQIERDLERQLGSNEPAAAMLQVRIRSCRGALALLAARGTPQFAVRARELFDAPSTDEMRLVPRLLSRLIASHPAATQCLPRLTSAAAADELRRRLAGSMNRAVTIRLSGNMLAEASAGGNYIKLRQRGRYTSRELALLEAHEGWAHLGTALNGRRQPECRFLCRGTPATVGLQEGLAVLCELLAGVSDAERLSRIRDRFEAVHMVRCGADFLEVHRFFRSRGATAAESYHRAVRIFRGSLPANCGPFPKDACYALGFVRLIGLIRNWSRELPSVNPKWLFAGKLAFGDLANLSGTQLAPPVFVPPPFRDAATLAILVGAAFDEPVAASCRNDKSAPPLVRQPGTLLSFPIATPPSARSA